MADEFEPSPNPKNSFQIFVKELQGISTPFDVYSETTVLELKYKINSDLNIPIKQQRLTYESKPLINENTMEFYGIRKHSTVHLLLRLRGG
ncbi:uncharacterized protein [Antedon mediterranea]|uniref:uncharacterized protein n=1 Tax=Antedon mediterranea TaxID=105859 RepID=UPI003AF60002